MAESVFATGVDDLVQRTFLALLERHDLPAGVPLRAYLFGIARNLLLRRFRFWIVDAVELFDGFGFTAQIDSTIPFGSYLADTQQPPERRDTMLACAPKLQIQVFSTIEQARTEKVLRECKTRLLALLLVDSRTVDQVLVHPDSALDFPTPAKQAADGDLRLQTFLVEIRAAGEYLDRRALRNRRPRDGRHAGLHRA